MRRLVNFLLVLILLAGVGVVLYPIASDQYSQYKNTLVMTAYVKAAQELPSEETQAMLDACRDYNEQLTGTDIGDAFTTVPSDVSPEYMALVNPGGDGVLGIIEIPKIGVKLPIYHTTDQEGLENGVGHVEGTSLPVGGETIHCVLAGHRGLPTARLFTDVDQMAVGDLFYIDVLNETKAYRVDQILIVEPQDTSDMRLFEGKDYVTLVTCTPYGINSHRLLVRGERTELDQVVEVLTVDGVEALPMWRTALIFAVPMFVPVWLLFLLIAGRRRGR